MGNSSSSHTPPTLKTMSSNIISQPRSLSSQTSSTTRSNSTSTRTSTASPLQDNASLAPPPYTPTAESQPAAVPPQEPPPVPPHDRDLRRASSTAVAAGPPPRPHRRTASHSHPSRPGRTRVASPFDARAPGEGVGGFLPPELRPLGSQYTRSNTTATRPQNATAARTSSSTHAASPSRTSGRPTSQAPPVRAANSEGQQNAPAPRTITRRASKEDPLELLRKFDTVIIVDDSSSMEGALWHEARDALAGIAEAAARYDASGIDLHFLNDRTVGSNLKSARDVRSLFDSVMPNGITPTGEKLEELLLDYLLKLEAPGETKPKPVNFVILTDGAPTDDPESVIVTAAKRLDAQHAPIAQVGIQFVQLGSDPQATEALQEMDDELANKHNIRDMVDTTLYTGQSLTTELLGKILLGGINRRVDKKGFQALT
ncbi:hypothetical protein JB92DRAFT_2806465 [Gautieria morchelliformis]|nr:hypothetical protein JB92DRAFT_2806465 [Gautieria morchelliformis]